MIVIDAPNIQCEYFTREVKHALAQVGPDALCDIRMVDPCVSRVYRESEMAEEELQSYPRGLRQTVSLGRFCLDPVSELCRLWHIDKINSINHILTLSLHSDLKYVPPEKVLYGLRQVLTQLVSDSGVNMNHLFKCPHLRPTLNFICGLGPVRAEDILEKMTLTGSYIASRRRFLDPEPMDIEGEESPEERFARLNKGFLREQVYKNAIMFLRVESSQEMMYHGEEETMVYLLDGTLVHPDDYEYAELVIANALNFEPQHFQIEGVDEETQYLHKVKTVNEFLQKIREDEPQSIDSLNLELFAEMHERENGSRILHKLNQIKKETKTHYTVGRKDLSDLESFDNTDYLFGLVTGESDRTLCVGQKITVKVTKIDHINGGIKCCLLDNNLLCWLSSYKISREIDDKMRKIKNKYDIDEQKKDENLKQLLREFCEVGEHIEARIIEIQKGKRRVTLSCLEEDMKNTRGDYEIPAKKCRYLITNHPDDDPDRAIEADNRRRDGPIKPFKPRQIDFPHFKNISREDAEKELATQEAGRIVIRPSSHGLDHLSLSWKMTSEPDIIVHYKIKELDKPNRYALGRKLEIERETYDELDELVAEFVEKLNEMKNKITSHDQFKFGTEEDVSEGLVDEKREKPYTIPYALSFSYKQHGRFLLSYIPGNTTVLKEYISLSPKGFRFRDVYFESPSHLINWFKKNPKKYPAKKKKGKKGRRERESRGRRHHSSSSTSPHNSSYNEESSQSYMSYDSSPNSHTSSSQQYDMAPYPPRNQGIVPRSYGHY